MGQTNRYKAHKIAINDQKTEKMKKSYKFEK